MSTLPLFDTPPPTPTPAPVPLTVPQLETWLWDAACAIRGATDAPKYKDFILPLVFYKRLADVYADELTQKAREFGGLETAQAVIQQDHAAALKEGRAPIVRFVVPAEFGWDRVRNFTARDETGYKTLGEFITTCLREVARLNPDLQGVLDVKDFAETQAGQRLLDDERLEALVEVVARHRLGLRDTAPDVLGQAYEYLLRKFAEGQGQSAGEFYTPAEVGLLMGELLEVPAHATVYDPTCGSGGLLIKARLAFERQHPGRRAEGPQLYGQELNPVTYAIARMNMILHDFTGARIGIGDTFRRPAFGAAGAGLQQFDRAVANPMWNQKGYPDSFFENDPWGRFGAERLPVATEAGGQAPATGLADVTVLVPPSSSADWAWMLHILASLKPGGRAAVVLDTGAVSRGSGSAGASKERDIRRAVVEADLVEGVVLLPENLFYNTTAPGIILLLRKDKPEARRGQVLLINAAQHFVKRKPKNELTLAGRTAIAEALAAWQDRPKLARVLTLAQVRQADYNLSPSQFVETGERATHRALAEILADVEDAKAEREAADARLAELLGKLLGGNSRMEQELELPEGWRRVSFGEVCRFTQKPRTVRLADYETVPFIPMDMVPIGGTGFSNYISKTPKEITSGVYFEEGDVLVARITPSFENGKQGIVSGLPTGFGFGSTEIIPFNSLKSISDRDFLSFTLLHSEIRTELASKMDGSTGRQRLNKSALAQYEISLPPLPEQRAIANVLGAVQEARDARRRELLLERERKAALLEQLFTRGTRGAETRETEIGELPVGWEVVRLVELIADGPQNGIYKHASFYGAGNPILRIDAFGFGDIISNQVLKRLNLSQEEIDRYSLNAGDIVINRVNGNVELVGKCAVVGKLKERTVFESNMMRFSLDDQIASHNYVVRFLCTSQARSQIRSKARVINQASINQQDVNSVVVPLPPLPEQEEIAAIMGACDGKIGALEAEIGRHEELFRALLEELLSGRRRCLAGASPPSPLSKREGD